MAKKIVRKKRPTTKVGLNAALSAALRKINEQRLEIYALRRLVAEHNVPMTVSCTVGDGTLKRI